MILQKKVEDNFIKFNHSAVLTHSKYGEPYYDDVFKVYWNRKTLFGEKRVEETYSWRRNKKFDKRNPDGNTSYNFTMIGEAEEFYNYLKDLDNKVNGAKQITEKEQNVLEILEKLKSEFKGSDDFSLGVHHAVNFITLSISGEEE